MSDFEFYERRMREAEELAGLVNMPQNRRHYLALAEAWRRQLAAARGEEPPAPAKTA